MDGKGQTLPAYPTQKEGLVVLCFAFPLRRQRHLPYLSPSGSQLSPSLPPAQYAVGAQPCNLLVGCLALVPCTAHEQRIPVGQICRLTRLHIRASHFLVALFGGAEEAKADGWRDMAGHPLPIRCGLPVLSKPPEKAR